MPSSDSGSSRYSSDRERFSGRRDGRDKSYSSSSSRNPVIVHNDQGKSYDPPRKSEYSSGRWK